MTRPFTIGLTGSIGMGKSTVAAMFADHDIPVFDADAQVHAMQGPGGLLVEPIEQEFPGTTDDNGVDRQKLGMAVLGDPEKLKKLEAIVHPVVAEQREAFLARYSEKDIVLFDIPLLFEKGGADNVDFIVVVSAPAETQRKRVLARAGMTAARFEDILKIQMPDAQKRAKADHIINTGTSIAETAEAVGNLVKMLRSRLASQ